MQINGKPVRFCMSSGFNAKYGGLEARLYVAIASKILSKYPIDMLVFETKPWKETYRQRVKLAGYYLASSKYVAEEKVGTLEEGTTVYSAESLPTDTFWLKLDDYGDEYVATFLFPDEY